eukprot:130345_1
MYSMTFNVQNEVLDHIISGFNPVVGIALDIIFLLENETTNGLQTADLVYESLCEISSGPISCKLTTRKHKRLRGLEREYCVVYSHYSHIDSVVYRENKRWFERVILIDQ